MPFALPSLTFETLLPLFFLSVFTIVGAASIGNGLRDIFLEPRQVKQGGSAVLFGVIFVGLALFVTTSNLGSQVGVPASLLALFQIALAAVVILGIFLLHGWLAPLFRRTDVMTGALFLVVGMAMVGMTLREGESVRVIVVGVLFAGMGGLVLVRALWQMASGKMPE